MNKHKIGIIMGKNTILLITTNIEKVNAIKERLIDDKYCVVTTRASSFMRDIYMQNPSVVLVDLDTTNTNGLELIDAGLGVEYIPTFTFYHRSNEPKQQVITDATTLDYFDLLTGLKLILEVSCKFRQNYALTKNGYETVKYMNTLNTENYTEYMQAEKNIEPELLLHSLHQVYPENNFIPNIPEGIWSFERKNELIDAHHYFSTFTKISEKHNFHTSEKFMKIFEKAEETGVFVDFERNSVADISDIEEILKNEAIDIPKLQNLAMYMENDYMLMAYNYEPALTDVDLDILRNACSRIISLKIYKTNLTEIEESFIYTMDALARAAESKDKVTGNHIKRVNSYSKLIAKKLGMEYEFVKSISIAAQMHDVGKISVPESILNKPGRLTEEEFTIMQHHTVFGEEIIGNSDHLSMAAEIARWHHEKYDGSGYPDGKRGEEIPLSARIVALADIYDALRSPRSYKEGFSHEEAYRILVEGDGRVEPSHIDPNILKVFKKHHEMFREIYDNDGE